MSGHHPLCVESKLNKADLRVRKHDIACCTYHHHHHTCEKRVRHEPNQPSILVRQTHLPVSIECAVTYVPKTWKTVDKSKEASPPTSVLRNMYPNGLSFGFTKCEERERERDLPWDHRQRTCGCIMSTRPVCLDWMAQV